MSCSTSGFFCAIYGKYQNTSTKLQINSKSQYSMTKTLLQGLWSFRFFQYRCFDEKSNSFSELERPFFEIIYGFRIWNFGHWNLPFDWAQGGELVEPFDICVLGFVISVFPGWGSLKFSHKVLWFPHPYLRSSFCPLPV